MSRHGLWPLVDIRRRAPSFMTADEMQMSHLHRAICSQFMTASDATPIDSPSTARFDMYSVFDGAIITLISDGLRVEPFR